MSTLIERLMESDEERIARILRKSHEHEEHDVHLYCAKCRKEIETDDMGYDSDTGELYCTDGCTIKANALKINMSSEHESERIMDLFPVPYIMREEAEHLCKAGKIKK